VVAHWPSNRCALCPGCGHCPLGYDASGNYCLSSPSIEREAIQKTGNSCPLGWFSSGSYCVKIADRHGFSFQPFCRSGPAALQFWQGWVEFDLRGWSRHLVQYSGGAQRWTAHHGGLAGHRLELEHGADARSARGDPGCWAAQGLPNSRRLRSGQYEILKAEVLAVLHQQLFAPGSTGQQLWELGLVSRLLADGSLGARTTGLLEVIDRPEAMQADLMRAQGQDDAKRRAQRCIEAVQEASRLAAARAWLR
jgi:hypothetical protein